ncbi:MAG: hypothetical protein ACJ790_02835, partial [Myxococcaceae bacterium]
WPEGLNCPKAFAWFATARIADASFVSETTHVDVVAERSIIDHPTGFSRLHFTPSMVGFSVQVQCVTDTFWAMRIDCSGAACKQTVLVALQRSISPLSTMHGDGAGLIATAKGKPELSVDQQVQLRNAVAAGLASVRDSLEVVCRGAKCRKPVQTLDDSLNDALVRKGRWKLAAVHPPSTGHRARVDFELGEGSVATLECTRAGQEQRASRSAVSQEVSCIVTGTLHGAPLRWAVDANNANESLSLAPGTVQLANNGVLEVDPSLLVMH